MPATPAPDTLTTYSAVAAQAGIKDLTEFSAINRLISFISPLIVKNLNRDFLLVSSPANPVTEYPAGRNYKDLVLRNTPIWVPSRSCTLTLGSPTVGGLTDVSDIYVGMPAVSFSTTSSTNPLPQGCAVAAVSSPPASVTLTANANLSGTFTVTFGLAVWLDMRGFYGDGAGVAGGGAGPFAQSTQMTLGIDYALKRDTLGGRSRSGILTRLGGGPTGFMVDWPWQWRRGSLTATLPPAWPDGQGYIKVTYWAGYDQMPADLELAVVRAILRCRESRWYGAFVTQTSFEDSSVTLEQNKSDILSYLLANEVNEVLKKYRNMVI